MGYHFDARQEYHATFLHPNGIPLDEEPYQTPWRIVLPGIISAQLELDELKEYVASTSKAEQENRPLPNLRQLARIAINETTGCWELPIYKQGKDVHTSSNHRHKAGKPRARYGSLMVKGANPKPTDHLAHLTMYRIFRGPIPDGHHIDHLCRNSKCCYHRHLEAVTPIENSSRARQAKTLLGGQLIFENSYIEETD